ncbi:MAG: putative CRISPR-associated protein [Rivularia sp. (in: cyanobacteria)]
MYRKPRLIISTVGTSLLTNQVYKYLSDEIESSLNKLEDSANYSHDEIKARREIWDTVQELEEYAEDILSKNNIKDVRKASAELNGIYELYDLDENKFEDAKFDTHYLITTDTAQGHITASLVKEYLRDKVNSVDIYVPDKLSTVSTKNFHQGIDDLIDWVAKKVKYFSNYDVYFNLVGGFKALQGCMNTIGMFYADKIVYVFEGKYSKLITIPRLPITVDKSKLKDHIAALALMDVGASLLPEETKTIPEAMVAEIDGKMTISNWGGLIWKRCEDDFLSKDLIEFPRIFYEGTFKGDYKNIKDVNDKVRLQKTIAKVSMKLEGSNGNTREVAKQVEYYPYQGAKDKDGVDHFYVGKQFRVSCKIKNGVLHLRHYGTHKYVEGKETN